MKYNWKIDRLDKEGDIITKVHWQFWASDGVNEEYCLGVADAPPALSDAKPSDKISEKVLIKWIQDHLLPGDLEWMEKHLKSRLEALNPPINTVEAIEEPVVEEKPKEDVINNGTDSKPKSNRKRSGSRARRPRKAATRTDN